jgi:SAM-dependent methyltransferase
VTTEFDSYRESYEAEVQSSIDFIGQEVDYFVEAKARKLVDLTRRWLGDPSRLAALDVGCGIGATDRHLSGRFAELHGVDIAVELIERASAENPSVAYQAYDGERLPYDDARFDLVFCVCVFHHVPTARWPRFAAELARVVRPGGLVAVFEHNPFNPLTRLAVQRCEFDREAVLLSRGRATAVLRAAGLELAERRYIVFLPFGGERMEPLERRLRNLPVGAQYYVAARRPQAAPRAQASRR